MKVQYTNIIKKWLDTDRSYRKKGINVTHTDFIVVRYQPKNKPMKTKMKQLNLQISSIMYMNDGVKVSDLYDSGKGGCVIDALVKI